ncbi:centrosomal protein of 128 kDa-like [Branchiostoma lanceolatum]|uniref:centrosomal protein of 128 kDa-like n=1 Tax=Branchiostoma lanceolatum TaxID=7740 RepID=UPI003451A8A5
MLLFAYTPGVTADSFREEEFEQFRQLQRELEQTSRNCRILQLRLRKAEKRNEQVEADRGNYSRVREIEQDLKVAKDVSVRLHHELEQVEEKRSRVEEQNQHLRHKLVKSETSRQALKGEVEKLRKQVQKAKTHNKGSDTEDASSAVSQATSAEAQSDVRRQLELVEEETNLMRQSLVEVEKDRDGLQFQLEQYKRKYGEFESSESEQAEQSESSNISKEAQLKLKLKLVEEEATTLGRKLIEMEVKNEKLGVELQKYRGRCKNMSASSSESEASYPESDMPENVEELRRQLQFLEEEADVLRRTVSDLEEQNHNLTAQVSRYQAEKKAGNLRPRGKDGGHDLKAKLRLLEEDNSISKQKLAAMEYDNRILVSTIQKYELEIKCAKSARTPDSGSKEDINKKQLEEEVTFLRNKLADMEGRNEDLARICAGNEQDMAAARQEKDVEKQISEFQRLEEMCLLEQNIEELQTHLEYLQTCLDRKDDVCKRQEKELTVMSEELRILKTEAGLKTDGEEFRWRKQPARDDIASAITPPSDDKKKSKSSKDGSPTKKTSTRSRGLKDMIAQDKTKTILHDASEDLNCETNGDSGIVEQHGGRSRLDMTSSGTATSPMGLTVVVDPDLKQVPLSGGKLQMLQEKLAKIEETRKLLLDCSAQTSDLRDKNGGLTEESPDWSAVLHVVDELQHHFDRLQKVCTDYGLLLRETQEQNSQMDDRQGEIDTLLQSLYDHCATISTNSSSLREHMTSLKTLLNRSDDNINNTPAALEIHAENSTEEPKLLQKYNQAYSSLQNLMQGVEDTVDCFVQPARERDGIAFRESATLRECGENSKLMAPTKGPETEPEQDTSGIARCKNVPQSPALQNDDRENGVSSKACVCQNRTECSQNHTVEAHKITSISGDGCEAVEDQTDTAAAAGTFKIVGGSSEESQHLETISSPNSAQEEAESPAHSFITPTVEVYPCERLDLVHLFAENLKLQDELEVREIEWTVQNFQLSYELDRLRELCTTIAQLAFSDTLVSATIPYQKDSPGGASLMEETLQEGRIADAEMKKILETLMTQVSGDLETNKDRNCKTSSDVTSPKDQTRADTSGKVNLRIALRMPSLKVCRIKISYVVEDQLLTQEGY